MRGVWPDNGSEASMKYLLTVVFCLWFSISQAFANFGYYSPISINSGQVPSTQTDFPVLVSVTDARFKTVANSGHVQNSSGFDIRPYSDSGLTTAITGYELERYNATTGEVVMWVKVGSLSSSTTPIYLAYGDSGISTDGSSTATWSNSFINVYHMKDGTTLSVADSTGTNNGTNHSATAATGQVDGCGSFASSGPQYITCLTASFSGPVAVTFSAWVKATTFANALETIIGTNLSGGAQSYVYLYVKSNGKLACYVLTGAGDKNYDGTGSHTLSTGTWYYLTFSYSSAAGGIGYVNAASDATFAGASNSSAANGDQRIGSDPRNASRDFNGVIDEARVASVARSADWITTEYNNQIAPGTFETLGTEVSAGTIISSNRVTNLFFSD